MSIYKKSHGRIRCSDRAPRSHSQCRGTRRTRSFRPLQPPRRRTIHRASRSTSHWRFSRAAEGGNGSDVNPDLHRTNGHNAHGEERSLNRQIQNRLPFPFKPPALIAIVPISAAMRKRSASSSRTAGLHTTRTSSTATTTASRARAPKSILMWLIDNGRQPVGCDRLLLLSSGFRVPGRPDRSGSIGR